MIRCFPATKNLRETQTVLYMYCAIALEEGFEVRTFEKTRIMS